LILSDSGPLIAKITQPRQKTWKTYWVHVENEPTDAQLDTLRNGVHLKDGVTAPARVQHIEPPEIPERVVPIRVRKRIPTSWLEVQICEGRNRQVRRMTAAVGLPTLRLLRTAIGSITLAGLEVGLHHELSEDELRSLWLG
jgi:23S rRNA pseudouridine2457 synthase